MSKDPRDGLKLRLGYEVAREIERTPIISLGIQDAAVTVSYTHLTLPTNREV